MVQPIRPQDAAGVYRRQLGETEAGQPAARPDADPNRPAAPARLPRTDSVSVSDHARSLRRIFEATTDGLGVREVRVAELRARIEAGDYDIDAETIARRLLADGLDA